jgi:hypothetical protein
MGRRGLAGGVLVEALAWSYRVGSDASFDVRDVASVAERTVITGSFVSSVDFGNGALQSLGNQDAFLAAFAPDGAHVLSRSFGPEGGQDGLDLSSAGGQSEQFALAGELSEAIDIGGVLHQAPSVDTYVVKFGI